MNKHFGRGIKCSIFYQYRNLLQDHSLQDDRMYLEFDPKKVDYADLADNILPAYVDIFESYRAVIYDEELLFADFEKSRNVNLRETILRFYPICFYDEELCLRSLHNPVSEIFDRLIQNNIKVSILGNGIFINYSSKFFTVQEADEFDSKISTILNH